MTRSSSVPNFVIRHTTRWRDGSSTRMVCITRLVNASTGSVGLASASCAVSVAKSMVMTGGTASQGHGVGPVQICVSVVQIMGMCSVLVETLTVSLCTVSIYAS